MGLDRENKTKIAAVIVGAVFMTAGFIYYAKSADKRESSIISPDDSGEFTQTVRLEETSPGEAGEEISFPIDINKATAEELEEVDGIGSVISGMIIEYRASNGGIGDIGELTVIDGIGDDTIDKLGRYFFVDTEDYTKFTEPATTTAAKKTTAKQTTTAAAATTTTTTTTTSAKAQTEREVVFPIDINKVTYDELIMIPGIGDVTANRILAFREHSGRISNMEQLLEIDGIGEATCQELYYYLYVNGADYSELTTTTVTEAETAHKTKRTSVSQATTTAGTTRSVTTTTQTAEPPKRKKVNINTATASEIADALLIEPDMAQMIVDFRDKIGGYVNMLEILNLEFYDKRFSDEFYNSIVDYIEI